MTGTANPLHFIAIAVSLQAVCALLAAGLPPPRSLERAMDRVVQEASNFSMARMALK